MAKWEDAPPSPLAGGGDTWEEAPVGDGEPQAKQSPFSLKTLGKEAVGAGVGAADVVAGALAFPISGLAGAAALPFVGPEKARGVVEKAQEMLSPGIALEKFGLPKDLASETDTHKMIMKLVQAPHEYLSKPISDAYFDHTGQPLAAAILQGQLDVIAYALSFGLAKRAAGAGARPRPVQELREELGYKETKPKGEIKWEDAPQLDLPLPERGIEYRQAEPGVPDVELPMGRADVVPPVVPMAGGRQGGMLSPERIARLEQELNQPARQGELLGEGRPYLPEELPGRSIEMLAEERKPSARERDIVQREIELERPPLEEPFRADVGEMESRQVPPYEMRGQQPQDRPIPYEKPGQLKDFGEAGERLRAGRDAFQEQIGRDQPIPYEPVTLPKRMRGNIDSDLLTFGVPRLINEFGSGKTLEKFRGMFHKAEWDALIQDTKDPKSRRTIVWMAPADFLHLASPLPSRGLYATRERTGPSAFDAKLKELETFARSEEGLRTIPALSADELGKIVAHDGRHRATMLQNLGIDQMPVALTHGTVRWGETPREQWPKKLIQQNDSSGRALVGKRFGTVDMPKLAFEEGGLLDTTPPLPPIRQRGAVTLTKRIKKDSSLVPAMLDFKKQFAVEKRPLTQLVKDEGINETTIKDIASNDPATGERFNKLLQEGASNLLIDKTMSILTADKGPVGKIIKWAVDGRRAIEFKKGQRINEQISNSLVAYRALFNKKGGKAELMQMKETWFQKIGNRELLKEADFASPEQWAVYRGIRDTLTKGWERVNEARERAGFKPVDFNPNHFPAVREGDYWIYIKDGKGETQWASAHTTVYEANRAYRRLKKEFSDFTVEKPLIRKKGEMEITDLGAFEETLRAMTKDNPMKAEIQQRYAKIMGTRGFGRTALYRKGIAGALGYEPGIKGLRNLEKVLEQHYKRQEAYLANMETAQLQRQLAQLDRKVADKMPMALNYLNEYLSAGRGADISRAKIISTFAESITTTAGFGRQGARHLMQDAASLVSLYLLLTPRFAAAQLVQHANALAKLRQMKNIDELVSSPSTAWFQGWHRTLSPDLVGKEALAWAKKNGYLESAVVEMLGMKMGDIRGERFGLIGDFNRVILGKLEEHAVRTPTFMMFEGALRKTIPDNLQRFEVASELMDYYMVHYSRESSPLGYAKADLLGEAARPLKQYAHNMWGQFFEFVKGAKDHQQYTPLAQFLGTQALVAGLKGTILVAEATAIINLINAGFDTDIPTPERWLLESGVSDFLVYGGWSSLLGYDISSSVAAPNMPDMFSFPIIGVSKDAMVDVATYLLHKIHGTDTEAQQMAAFQAISPRLMHGWIQELYSRPGQPVPNPRDNMKGNYRRNEVEKFVASMFSVKSIDEAKSNAVVRNAKELLARDAERRLSALDAIADRIQTGQKLTPDLLKRYVAEGGFPGDLAKNIRQRIMDRQLTWPERQGMIKQMTPGQAHKMDRMRELLNSITKQDREHPRVREIEGGPTVQKQGTLLDKQELVKNPQAVGNTIVREFIGRARRKFPNNPQMQIDWVSRQIEQYNKQSSARERGEPTELESELLELGKRMRSNPVRRM